MSSRSYLRRKGNKRMPNRPKGVSTNAILEEKAEKPDTRGKDRGGYSPQEGKDSAGTPEGTRPEEEAPEAGQDGPA